ncbi:MAG: hypothetical protein IKW51_08770 [Bacteroidales bacterium]|nr:hypothetical protein [Bacteroidales bacterium]
MYYYESTTAKKLVELEINNRKEALKLYDEIIPVIKKFDKKVLNKRLETALQQVNQYLRIDRNYSSFSIMLYVQDNYVKSKPDRNGCCMASYVQTRQLSLTTALFTSDGYMKDKIMIDDEGRIRSDVIINALEQGRNNMEEHIKMLEESLPNVEEYKQKLESLKNEIENTTKEIPFLIREYFDLNYRVTIN